MNFFQSRPTGRGCFDHEVLFPQKNNRSVSRFITTTGLKIADNFTNLVSKRIQSLKLDLHIHWSITLTQLEVQAIFQRIFTSDRVQKSPWYYQATFTRMIRLIAPLRVKRLSCYSKLPRSS